MKKKEQWINEGDRWGRWDVLEIIPPCYKTMVRVKCTCGSGIEKVLQLQSVYHGNSKSCGCLRRENGIKQAARMRAKRWKKAS